MNRSWKDDAQLTLDRFRAFPRILQWVIIAAFAVILFLIWDQYIAPTTSDWNARADRIEAQLRAVRDADRLNRDIRQLRETIVGAGDVQLSSDPEEGRAAQMQAVNDVKARFSISNDSFNHRPASTIRRGALAGLPGGDRTQVVTGELRFDASPEDAMALIAKLESRPEINRISSLNIMKLANRRVNVRLSLETWVIAGPAGARGSA